MERVKRSNSQSALRPFRGKKEYSTIVNCHYFILESFSSFNRSFMIKKTLLPVDGSEAGGNKIKYSFSLDHFAESTVLMVACIVHLQGRAGHAVLP